MCGEHLVEECGFVFFEGSSPHVRGTLRAPNTRISAPGIIPACAGNTPYGMRNASSNGDHPRMCGEHMVTLNVASQQLGSSPHVRGTLERTIVSIESAGIIPACAGNTTPAEACAASDRDHPRMCGEHRLLDSKKNDVAGSSPHVRGTLAISPYPRFRLRIIPACAGNTRLVSVGSPRVRDHPRMCGEHEPIAE